MSLKPRIKEVYKFIIIQCLLYYLGFNFKVKFCESTLEKECNFLKVQKYSFHLFF